MELVTPKDLNKPRNVNRFKKGLEKLWCPISYWLLKRVLRCLGALPTFDITKAAAILLCKASLCPACSNGGANHWTDPIWSLFCSCILKGGLQRSALAEVSENWTLVQAWLLKSCVIAGMSLKPPQTPMKWACLYCSSWHPSITVRIKCDNVY